ncbi:hypothetical protein HAX54_013302 [Datura stramonium]|uniref:Uncharacterized protein n=1 Tax=Datura stramonium TaxID=4076 RepID=A0ABS8TL43_DATST|nr:hypothetical protein [Datura stramonium]
MEQVGIEAAQKKEEEWQKEVEAVRNQHAVDVVALLSATQELQRENVEILSAELVRLKSLLDILDLWNETEINAKNKLVEDLKLEIETLKEELRKQKAKLNW